ncbi:unnamed protein product, partial [Meganyctiphanes norvegica]
LARILVSFLSTPAWLLQQLNSDLIELTMSRLLKGNVMSCVFLMVRSRLISGMGRSTFSIGSSEVSTILRQNESLVQLSVASDDDSWNEESSPLHCVASVDTNQLSSNSPIEDKLAAARCLLTEGLLFGVFDGHGGPECSQVVSKRLFEYIALALLPRDALQRVVDSWEAGNSLPLIEVYNDPSTFVPELQEVYQASLLRYAKHLLTRKQKVFSMEEAMKGAFMSLDADMGREVLENESSAVLEPLLRVAISGSVACVAHIDGPHLHIANAGDCGAVLGMESDSRAGCWRAKRLSQDHNWENLHEVNRVLAEHPESESEYVVRDQRLLGMLMPFRALGDHRFKWDTNVRKNVIEKYVGEDLIPTVCSTPPYLTSEPEIVYHRLGPRDNFLVMGSDGLWECMNVIDVITLTGEYMSGRQTLQPVRFPHRPVSLDEIALLLEKRQEGLKLKPTDTNAATHLIRHSLGGTESGLDHSRLSHSLTLPPEVRRFFRDDISIHVVFFDQDFLRRCPVEI